MNRLRLLVLCSAVVALAATVASASAARAAAPDLKKGALAAADVAPGVRIASDEPGDPDDLDEGIQAELERTFDVAGVKVGGSQLVTLTETITLYSTAAGARDSVQATLGLYRSPLATSMFPAAGTSGTKARITGVRSIKAGELAGSVGLDMTQKGDRPAHLAQAVAYVGRVAVTLMAIGPAGAVRDADLDALLVKAVQRASAIQGSAPAGNPDAVPVAVSLLPRMLLPAAQVQGYGTQPVQGSRATISNADQADTTWDADDSAASTAKAGRVTGAVLGWSTKSGQTFGTAVDAFASPEQASAYLRYLVADARSAARAGDLGGGLRATGFAVLSPGVLGDEAAGWSLHLTDGKAADHETVVVFRVGRLLGSALISSPADDKAFPGVAAANAAALLARIESVLTGPVPAVPAAGSKASGSPKELAAAAALQLTDLPRTAKLEGQTETAADDGALVAYDRAFDLDAAPFGQSRIHGVYVSAAVFASAGTAKGALALGRRAAGSPLGIATFKRLAADDPNMAGAKPRFGTVRTVAVGDQAWLRTIAVDKALFDQSYRLWDAGVLVGRVVVQVSVTAGTTVSEGDVVELLRRAAARAAVVR